MAWRRLAGAAAAAQPARGSADPKVSDSIRTNGPYLQARGHDRVPATVSILARDRRAGPLVASYRDRECSK
jgi:hypothetical protein